MHVSYYFMPNFPRCVFDHICLSNRRGLIVDITRNGYMRNAQIEEPVETSTSFSGIACT
jgi:hypothetical protein